MITGTPLFQRALIIKSEYCFKGFCLKSKNLKEIEVPQTYEELLDEAEIVGIMLGDGHLRSDRGYIRLRVRELDFCLHFAALIKRTYGIDAPVDDKYYYNCYAYSTLLAKRLAKLTKNNAQIPEFVLKGDKNIKARFIRGFSDSEGSVDVIYNRRQIVITQADTALLEKIKRLLWDIGIQSKVLRKKFGSDKLIISLLENLEKYQELVGFSIGYKSKKLAEAVEYLKKCKSYDKQQYWGALRYNLNCRKSLRAAARDLNIVWETYRSWIYGRKMPMQIKRNIEFGLVPEDYEDLREQYSFLPIVSHNTI